MDNKTTEQATPAVDNKPKTSLDSKPDTKSDSNLKSKQKAKPKINSYKVCTIVLGVVVAIETITLATFAAMVWTKGLEVVSTAGGKRIAEIYNVCDNKIIDRWNKIYDFESHKDKNLNPVPEVKKIAADLKKLRNYDKDPTCQYFIFQSAVYDNDTDSMKRALSAIEKSSQNGVYVSDHILYRQSIDSMRDTLKQFKK